MVEVTSPTKDISGNGITIFKFNKHSYKEEREVLRFHIALFTKPIVAIQHTILVQQNAGDILI